MMRNNAAWIALAMFIAIGVALIYRNHQVRKECSATQQMRDHQGIIMAGKVMIPRTVHERLYICPDGSTAWLED